MRLVRRAWLPWRINISAFHPFRWIFGGQEKDRAGGEAKKHKTLIIADVVYRVHNSQHSCGCRLPVSARQGEPRANGFIAGPDPVWTAQAQAQSGLARVRFWLAYRGLLGGVLWGFQREQSAAADCDTAYLMQYDFCRACQWAGRPTIKPGCREKDPDPFQRQGGTLR